MLPLLDAKYVGYNADMLALYAHEVRPKPAERRRAYLTALLQLQPQPIIFDTAPHLHLHFDLDEPVARDGLLILLHDRSLHADSSCVSEAALITEHVRAAEQLLYDYSRSAFSSIHLLIGSILVARLPVIQGTGSSNGNLLGSFWMSSQRDWRTSDYAEIILHEGVHQSIFLDDMVNRTFRMSPSSFDDAKYLVPSPSLAMLRPYDLAFHSSLVVAAVLGFYAAMNLPRPAHVEGNRGRLAESVRALRAQDAVLTEHGLWLLGRLEEEVAHLESGASGARSPRAQ